MYQTLTFLHSTFRWLVLLSLLYSIFRAYRGYFSGKEFSKTDDAVRHWTATIAHFQLVLALFYTLKARPSVISGKISKLLKNHLIFSFSASSTSH